MVKEADFPPLFKLYGKRYRNELSIKHICLNLFQMSRYDLQGIWGQVIAVNKAAACEAKQSLDLL